MNLNIRKIIFSFFVLTSSIQSYSQNLDSIINSEMKNKNVTEYGYKKLSCIGYGVILEAYLFWIENDSTYIQKLKYFRDKDRVIKYKPIIIRDSVFFSYYKNHKERLLKEEVIDFNYKLDSIVGDHEYSTSVMSSHSCFSYFIIKSDNTKFDKRFDHFDIKEFDRKKIYASKMTKEEVNKWKERDLWELDTDSIFENYPIKNIHFESNNNLKIVEWDKLLNDFVGKMESENKFEELKEQ